MAIILEPIPSFLGAPLFSSVLSFALTDFSSDFNFFESSEPGAMDFDLDLRPPYVLNRLPSDSLGVFLPASGFLDLALRELNDVVESSVTEWDAVSERSHCRSR